MVGRRECVFAVKKPGIWIATVRIGWTWRRPFRIRTLVGMKRISDLPSYMRGAP